ncbi:MAG: hypothetical protein RL732_137 [Bacteroidota bacterium]|jgi:3-oxo-5-alpha-steroid 4-dehydrogenase 1
MSNVEWICWGWIGIAAITHIILFYVKAPFGRHTSDKWGMTMDNKWGWFVMELPSLLIMAYFLIKGTYSHLSYVWILFAIWMLHYINRTIIYPMRIKPTPKRMPLVIVASAIFFNCVNAGLNGYYLAEIAPAADYGQDWLTSLHFLTGGIVFLTGMFINWNSDSVLINLRNKGESNYRVPHGLLFDRVSSPNLLGEVIEWVGFAIMAWNLPAVSFAVWTYANLVPRAKNHHNWYIGYFDHYPRQRKAIFPYIY